VDSPKNYNTLQQKTTTHYNKKLQHTTTKNYNTLQQKTTTHYNKKTTTHYNKKQ